MAHERYAVRRPRPRPRRRGPVVPGETLRSAPGVLLAAIAVLLGAISWSIGIVYSRRSHLSGNPSCSPPCRSYPAEPCCFLPAPSSENGAVSLTAAVSPRSLWALAYLIVLRLHRSLHGLQLASGNATRPPSSPRIPTSTRWCVLLGWRLAGEKSRSAWEWRRR